MIEKLIIIPNLKDGTLEAALWHETGAVTQGHRVVTGGEGGLGKVAAAGGFVMVWVVEVDTDGPLSSGSPDSSPCPLSTARGKGHAQVILNISISIG